MKKCIRCEGSMEGEKPRARVCSTCKSKKGKTTKVAKPVKNDIIDKPVVKEQGRDKVPNLQFFPKITIYAYPIGTRGYRFTTKPRAMSVWSKDFTGNDAMSFLRGVKSKNKYGRLEALHLPEK